MSSTNLKPTASFFSAPVTSNHPFWKLRIFSIGQIIGESIDDCEFRERFSDYEGTVAVDLDERFAGWRLGIVESTALKPAEGWELLDGVIVY